MHIYRFEPTKFEEIFAKHAKTNPNALTKAELQEMLKKNKEPKDLPGQYVHLKFPYIISLFNSLPKRLV